MPSCPIALYRRNLVNFKTVRNFHFPSLDLEFYILPSGRTFLRKYIYIYIYIYIIFESPLLLSVFIKFHDRCYGNVVFICVLVIKYDIFPCRFLDAIKCKAHFDSDTYVMCSGFGKPFRFHTWQYSRLDGTTVKNYAPLKFSFLSSI
jgi:hypothetical protein